MNHTLFKLSAVALLLLSTQANAFEFDKPMHFSLPVNSQSIAANQKEVIATVMRVRLTKAERAAIENRNITPLPAASVGTLPASVDLTMNHVPVLNQGRHGSCVTFASTAAIDAVLGKGDYVSQLCNLEIGETISKHSYLYSGWDGSFGPLVLTQMMDFGIVNKEAEAKGVCAGVTHYPVNNESDKGQPMSFEEFDQSRENLNGKVHWEHILSDDHIADVMDGGGDKMPDVLLAVKRSLANNNRVTFGTVLIIPSSRNCSVGACAKHGAAHDTWALTNEVNTDDSEQGGHEMVIYGYDDNAVATDASGKTYTGLLKLRNSWSAAAGDHGDYYMTYDYFMRYSMEVQEIVKG